VAKRKAAEIGLTLAVPDFRAHAALFPSYLASPGTLASAGHAFLLNEPFALNRREREDLF
jgi:hypothetical protein